jgi:hypothetical protein
MDSDAFAQDVAWTPEEPRTATRLEAFSVPVAITERRRADRRTRRKRHRAVDVELYIRARICLRWR